MTNENSLMEKLMVSKKMIDIHNQTPRGGLPSMNSYNSPEVESYDAPQAKYSLPQEFLQENSSSNEPIYRQYQKHQRCHNLLQVIELCRLNYLTK